MLLTVGQTFLFGYKPHVREKPFCWSKLHVEQKPMVGQQLTVGQMFLFGCKPYVR